MALRVTLIAHRVMSGDTWGRDLLQSLTQIGGIVTSFLLELLIYPVIFEIWRSWQHRKRFTAIA
ncbi:MAG: hypothetical protein HY574_07950 [candidate division NC10 bacterium]|nr:hypothetical protein [candidate division NC10 bacterium]